MASFMWNIDLYVTWAHFDWLIFGFRCACDSYEARKTNIYQTNTNNKKCILSINVESKKNRLDYWHINKNISAGCPSLCSFWTEIKWINSIYISNFINWLTNNTIQYNRTLAGDWTYLDGKLSLHFKLISKWLQQQITIAFTLCF